MAAVVREVAGRTYLAAVTALLQRSRLEHPTAGLWEAADLQWWWRRDQHPDPTRQAFWFDDDEPVAAVVVTDWGGWWGLDVISASGDPLAIPGLWPRALAALDGRAGRPVETAVRTDDRSLPAVLAAAGFAPTAERSVTTSLAADERPAVSPLPPRLELFDRGERMAWPHHMIDRNGPAVEARLRDCSLYRPDLDLVVCDADGSVAGYGLFWADPVTGVGLVEPMRTNEPFGGRGIARHVLTSGLDRLAGAGCSTLRVTYMDDNPTARHLYLSAGFAPTFASTTWRRPEASD